MRDEVFLPFLFWIYFCQLPFPFSSSSNYKILLLFLEISHPLNFPRCEKIHSTSQSRHLLLLISLNYFSLFAPPSLICCGSTVFLLFGRFSPLFPLRENPDTVFPSVPLTAQRPSRCLHLTSESDQLYG